MLFNSEKKIPLIDLSKVKEGDEVHVKFDDKTITTLQGHIKKSILFWGIKGFEEKVYTPREVEVLVDYFIDLVNIVSPQSSPKIREVLHRYIKGTFSSEAEKISEIQEMANRDKKEICVILSDGRSVDIYPR